MALASYPFVGSELSTDEAEFLTRSLEAQSQREASELKAAQELARAEAARAEEAEKRSKEQKESANKLRRRAFVAAGAAGVALILLVVSAFLWRKSESASVKAEEQARKAARPRRARHGSPARQRGRSLCAWLWAPKHCLVGY